VSRHLINVPLNLLASPFIPAARRVGASVRLHHDTLICSETGQKIPVVRGVPDCRLTDDGEISGKKEGFERIYSSACRTGTVCDPVYLRQVEPLLRLIDAHCRDIPLAGPTLEVGCGMGVLAERLPGYVGLDYVMAILQAKGFEPFSRVCASANDMPFQSGSFATVITNNALEHVPEVHRAFAEIDRVLKPGGLLLFKMAWHCTTYNNIGIPNRPYADLPIRHKLTKALLPIIRSKPYKFLTRVPRRIGRRAFSRWPTALRYRVLSPSMEYYGLPDHDAYCDVDCHEGLMYFESRGYKCLTHLSYADKVLAGQDVLAFRKWTEQGVAKQAAESLP